MSNLCDTLRKTTEQMAATCSAPIELWCAHSDAVLKAAKEIEALRGMIPARRLSDEQLSDEIASVDAVIDGGFGEGGGSPGEAWYERADELEHERKRRELESQLQQHNSRASRPA